LSSFVAGAPPPHHSLAAIPATDLRSLGSRTLDRNRRIAPALPNVGLTSHSETSAEFTDVDSGFHSRDKRCHFFEYGGNLAAIRRSKEGAFLTK
jgi:hypothetical protein